MGKVTCNNCGAENATRARYCSDCGFELPKIEISANEKVATQPLKKGGNKVFGIVIGIVAFVLCFFAVQQLFFDAPGYNKELMKIASELNESCPIMVDSETRLDNSVTLPGDIFQYNYTLVNMEKATTDTLGMRNYLEPAILNLVKTNPQMEYQREHNITVNYFYKDKNGEFLLLISVTPDKYKE